MKTLKLVLLLAVLFLDSVNSSPNIFDDLVGVFKHKENHKPVKPGKECSGKF